MMTIMKANYTGIKRSLNRYADRNPYRFLAISLFAGPLLVLTLMSAGIFAVMMPISYLMGWI